MGSADYLKWGLWNVICDRCGVKRKSDEVKKEWTGLIVCRDKCFEERHPQDLIRAVPDETEVPFSRPEAPDVFIEPAINYSEVSLTFYPVSSLIAWVPSVQGDIFVLTQGYTIGSYTIPDLATIKVNGTWSII